MDLQLPTTEQPTNLQGQPGASISSSGRYYHPDLPFELTGADFLRWRFSKNPYAEQKRRETWRAIVRKDDSFLHRSHDVAVWLGHASFFLRQNGVNILLDPVFGKLSPLLPRHSELPVSPDSFRNIDLVLVTHDHRDHCDASSLRSLLRNNPRATVVTGLGMAAVIGAWAQGHRIVELDWHQQLDLQALGLRVTYLPTRHWGRRWLTDMNRRLWGAFVMESPSSTLYLGGDSGYGPHFERTRALFPNIDVALLGIGAFAPEWFMRTNHMGPADALRAFADLGAHTLVPMHYGTFDLSDEPLGEPARLLRQLIAEGALRSGQVHFSDIGEALHLP